jgi:signal transduction histidine kinase
MLHETAFDRSRVTALSPLVEHDGAFPRGRELWAIAGFWIVFAGLSVTNVLFPPGGGAPPVSGAIVGISIAYSLTWAVATPPIFWLARRYSADTPHRARRIVMYLAIAIVVALAVDVATELVRRQLLSPPPGGGRFGDGRQRSMWVFVRGRFLNEFTVFAAILSAGVARDYFIRYQRRLKESADLRAQLAEARLMALQNQLNPHFLFNTLHAIAALVERDPVGVRRMIARLSELLRATLDTSPEPEISLARELALAKRYLEILEIRFEGRLRVQVDASPDIENALVPLLILQPVIENAMKHAVGQTSAESRIEVRARREDFDLVLTVADSGADGSTGAPASDGTGIGLSNTRARLAQLYPGEHELTLSPNEIGGTTVTMRVPYHTSPVA